MSQDSQPSLLSRFRGCLIGLATGDAVGTTVEFHPPGSFPPVSDMQGGGKFNLQPGQWTDDTSMALCLAESLIETGAYRPEDQSGRYWKWYEDGHLSSTGQCFDIGMTTQKAIHAFNRHGQAAGNGYCGPTSDRAAGNGSLMRLCPVPLTFWREPRMAMNLSGDSSRTTHGAAQAIHACRYYAGLLVGCLQGKSKEELLFPLYSPVDGFWQEEGNSMHEDVAAVAEGSFKTLQPPEIKSTGYVVKSMEAALWAFYHTDTFKEGCLKVVNLGDDADTAAAIYGQLAGAFYGVESIPDNWRGKLALLPLLELVAEELCLMADNVHTPSWPLSQKVSSFYKASKKYQFIKVIGYNLLEERVRLIIRRLQPGPKVYKSLAEVERDVEELRTDYYSIPSEGQNDQLLQSFLDILQPWKEQLSKRLQRGHV